MNRTLLIILLVVCVAALIFILAVIIPRLKTAFAHTPTIVYVIISLILLAAIAVLLVNLFAPKGFEGNDDKPKVIEDVNSETRYAGETVYIYVRGDEISVGEMLMSDENECVTTVEGLIKEGAEEVYLIDDYAQSSIYRNIMNELDGKGIKYLTKEQ